MIIRSSALEELLLGERLNELSGLHPELSKALDTEECMPKAQGILLGKLVAEGNRLKRLTESPNRSIADLMDELKR